MSQLTPHSIVDAAAADLLAREHKRDGKLSYGVRYCFVREHVLRADSVPELLALAINDRQRGLRCCKRLTRAIYGDPAILEAALVRARKAPS